MLIIIAMKEISIYWKCGSDNVLINYSAFILRSRHITKNVLGDGISNWKQQTPAATSCKMFVVSMRTEQHMWLRKTLYFLRQVVVVNKTRRTPMSHWKHLRLTTPPHQKKTHFRKKKMKWLSLKIYTLPDTFFA